MDDIEYEEMRNAIHQNLKAAYMNDPGSLSTEMKAMLAIMATNKYAGFADYKKVLDEIVVELKDLNLKFSSADYLGPALEELAAFLPKPGIAIKDRDTFLDAFIAKVEVSVSAAEALCAGVHAGTSENPAQDMDRVMGMDAGHAVMVPRLLRPWIKELGPESCKLLSDRIKNCSDFASNYVWKAAGII